MHREEGLTVPAIPLLSASTTLRSPCYRGGYHPSIHLLSPAIGLHLSPLVTPAGWKRLARAFPQRAPTSCAPLRSVEPLPTDHRSDAARALPRLQEIGQVRLMTNLAPIEPERKPAKPRVVSRRVRHAIDLIINGDAKTQKAAAEKAGLTRERFCRALKESHVIEYLDGQTRVLLAQSRAPAAATLMTLLEQAKSEHVRKDVAVTLLGYSGIHATGERGPLVTIGFGAGPGYVLDFSTKGNADVVTDIGVAGGTIYDRVPAGMIDVTPTPKEAAE